MPFQKGGGRPGGRQKGTPNRSTAAARDAIAAFVDNNVERLQGWLDAIADDPDYGPKVAFDCVTNLLEYHVPKLARTELTGKDGAAVATTVTHVYEDAPKREDGK